MNESELTGKIIRSHAAGAVLYRLPEPNRLEIAAMNYCREGKTTLRVFMGKQGFAEHGRPETFVETLTREIRSEAFDISVPFKYENELKSLVHWELVPDDTEPERDVNRAKLLHLKGFFGLKFLQGALRSHRLLEHEGTKKEEILDPPQWIEIGELWRRMDVRGTSPFVHKKAVVGCLHRLALKESGLVFRYQDLLDTTAGIIRTIPEHKGLVVAYLDSLNLELANGKN